MKRVLFLSLLLLAATGAHAGGLVQGGSPSGNLTGSKITPSTVTISNDGSGSACLSIGSTFTVNCQTGTSTFGGSVVASTHTFVFARTATSFVLPSGVDTKINFNTATNDTINEFNTTTSSGTFTARFAGCYVNDASTLTGEAETSGDLFNLNLYKNGSLLLNGPRSFISAATNASAEFHGSVKLAAGDTLDLRFFHNHGSDVTLFGSNTRNWWTIVRVPCP